MFFVPYQARGPLRTALLVSVALSDITLSVRDNPASLKPEPESQCWQAISDSNRGSLRLAAASATVTVGSRRPRAGRRRRARSRSRLPVALSGPAVPVTESDRNSGCRKCIAGPGLRPLQSQWDSPARRVPVTEASPPRRHWRSYGLVSVFYSCYS